MERLKRLARHPLKIMDDLLAAAAAVAAAPDLGWDEKAERLRAKQEACLQEMEANYAAFRRAAAFVRGDGLPAIVDNSLEVREDIACRKTRVRRDMLTAILI